jgi:HAD superfamily hydrolase (TIGR01509 family)
MTRDAQDAGSTGRHRAFDLVIFDCDGVLVDSEILSTRLDAEFLAKLGWPLSREEIIERWLGRTDAAMRAEIEQHLGRDIGDEWIGFSDRYLRVFAEELEPVDGVADAVDAIQAAGYETCVASSGDHGKIRRNLAKTGLLDRFGDRLFGAEDVARGKPHPDLFLRAASELGIEPARTAVVEDSAHGVAAARNAGMWAFAYAGGVTRASALDGPSTTVFEDMRELPRLIDEHPLAPEGDGPSRTSRRRSRA